MKIKNQSILNFVGFLSVFFVRKTIGLTGLIAIPHFVTVLPLLGILFNAPTGLCFFTAYCFLKYMLGITSITMGIPTALSILSWSINMDTSTSRIQKIADLVLHVLFPSLCMTVFMTHYGTQDASAYALYWLIPTILWLIKTTTNTQTGLLFALQSTFVAHATGSIIWLYMMPTSAAYWTSLIPVVAAERLVMASCMLIAYHCIISISGFLHTRFAGFDVTKLSLKNNI